jgi:hypothetical protein
MLYPEKEVLTAIMQEIYVTARASFGLNAIDWWKSLCRW